MKNLIKAVLFISLLSLLSGLLSGCFLINSNVKDGDGMVNFNGCFLAMYDGK